MNNLDSSVDEFANGAHPAAQVEITRRTMAHSRISLLHQDNLVFFQVDRMCEYCARTE
jgi:hypothetical protein